MLGYIVKIFLCLISIFLHVDTFTLKQYEIYDIQSENSSTFGQETQSWRNFYSPSQTNNQFSCNGIPLLGSLGLSSVPFSSYHKLYTGLPSYKNVYITFTLYILQRPETYLSLSNFFEVLVARNASFPGFGNVYGELTDPRPLDSSIFSLIEQDGGLCNFNSTYKLVTADVLIYSTSLNTSNYLGLKFSGSYLPHMYYGVRNLKILLSTKTAASNSFKFCTSLKLQGLPIKNQCKCPQGSFNSSLSNCELCDSSCENCFGPTSAGCISCKSNYVYNGTNCNPCHPTCKTCNGTSQNQCLSCETGYSYNGTHCNLICHPTCKTCNGSLANQCLTCEIGGSLGITQITKFLYEDGTCADSCNFPLQQKDGLDTKYCKKPCNTDMYYDLDTNTCETSCLSPYSVNQKDGSCILQIKPEELKQLQTLSSVKDTSATVVSAGLAVTSVGFPGDSGAISVGMITKMLKYIRYLNISHSAKLEVMFKNEKTSTSPLDTVLEVDKQVQGIVDYSPVPPTFAKYKVHSDFLVNFWDNVPILSSIFVIWLTLHTLRLAIQLRKKTSGAISTINKLIVTTQNLFLTFFYASFGDIVLFSGLELRTIALSLPFSLLSFSLCVFLLITSSLTIGLHIKVLINHQRIIKAVQGIEDKELENQFQERHEGFKVFFFNFKNSSFFQEAFLLLFIIRVIIFHTILVSLYEYPLIQISMVVTMNIGMLLYLGLRRPMKKLVDFLQQLSIEALMLGINISLLILAISDAQGYPQSHLIDSISEVIIMSNVLFNYLPLAFMAAKVLILGKEFYESRKAKKPRLEKKLSDSKLQLRSVRKSQTTRNNNTITESTISYQNQSIDHILNRSTTANPLESVDQEPRMTRNFSMLDQISPVNRVSKPKIFRPPRETIVEINK